MRRGRGGGVGGCRSASNSLVRSQRLTRVCIIFVNSFFACFKELVGLNVICGWIFFVSVRSKNGSAWVRYNRDLPTSI